ncbi:MAG: PHP domain-containing protein [Clostridiaceae bacterium]|nr:PHP domain-containing protein [Clostridiaceae bacterium]
MREYLADLHIHSLLSPCAEIEMTPKNIILNAKKLGVDIIAITDHNACDNVPAAIEAVTLNNLNVLVLPGMEVESKEEAHFVVLFEKMKQLNEFEKFVKENMSNLKNKPDMFGAQFIVDSDDNFVAEKEELLISSLNVELVKIVEKVNSIGGIIFASHVDKPTYSIISQLGFIPPDLDLTAIELSPNIKDIEKAKQLFPSISKFPILTNSDAHTMYDFINGPKTKFYLKEPTFNEIKKYLKSMYNQ